MPSAFAVARAGAVLTARSRSLASIVLESVMAAVPTNPATSPSPTAADSVLVRIMPSPPPGRRQAGRDGGRRRAQALDEVVADPQRVRDGGQRRVHGTARREEARVDDVEVVDVVRLAVHVERRGRRIGPE